MNPLELTSYKNYYEYSKKSCYQEIFVETLLEKRHNELFKIFFHMYKNILRDISDSHVEVLAHMKANKILLNSVYSEKFEIILKNLDDKILKNMK